MKGKGKISYWMNPAWGLLPFLLYALLVNFMNFKYALLYCFIVAVASLFFLPCFFKHKVFPFFLFVSIGILALNYLLSLLPFSLNGRFWIRLFPEFSILILMCLILFNRHRFVKWMYQVQERYLPFSIKSSFYETFFLFRILKHFIIIYLVIVLSYFIFFSDYHAPELHRFMFGELRFLMILIVIVFSLVRLYWLNRRFRNEDWLPIIDEDAQVIGKIARTVSYQFKEKYLHPHLRILVFHKGKIYLQMRDSHRLSDIKGYDTPLAQDLCYLQDFTGGVNELMHKAGLPSGLHPKFFTRYIFERKQLRRMVFLYTLIVSDDSFLSDKFFRKGKLWTEQEIDNNIGKGVFAEVFEEEYELLKTTVFPVMKMMY